MQDYTHSTEAQTCFLRVCELLIIQLDCQIWTLTKTRLLLIFLFLIFFRVKQVKVRQC